MDHPAPRILIVEDDQRLAELTAEYLQANGYEVSVEGDGLQVLGGELGQALVVFDDEDAGCGVVHGFGLCLLFFSGLYRPLRGLARSHKDRTAFMACTVPVGAGVPAKRPVQET